MTKSECEKILLDAGFVRSDSGRFWFRPGTYVLNYGEYDSPNYYVRHRSGKNWGIKVEYYYYPGTFFAPVNHFLSSEELYYLDPRHKEF